MNWIKRIFRKKVEKQCDIDLVSKCHDSGHNTYIDYDGECGACGSKEKE